MPFSDDTTLQDRAINAYLMRRLADQQQAMTVPDTNVPAESRGITGSVLDFLENFNRLDAGLYTGLSKLGTDEGFLGGFKKGFMLDPDRMRGLADYLGMEEGQSDDGWGDWLWKEGKRFGADVLGSPLTYLFAPAKAGGILKSGIGMGPALLAAGMPEGRSIAGALAKKAGSEGLNEWFHGTGIGKVVAPGLPGTEKYQPFRDLEAQINREGSKLPVLEAAAKARGEVTPALKDSPYTLLDVAHGAEYPGEVAPDLRQISEALRPLKGMADTGHAEKNAVREAFGLPPEARIQAEGYEYLPHPQTKKGLLRLRKLGETEITRDALKKESREITRFLDEYGQAFTDEAGNAIVGKPNDPRTIKALGDAIARMGLDIKPTELNRLPQAPATLKEAARIMPEGTMLEDPIEALQQHVIGQRAQVNTLKLMDALRQEGQIVNPLISGPAPESWRPLAIPGFKDWQTSPQIANWLENLAGVPTDWLGKSLQRIRQITPIGQGLEDATQWWKHNVLSGLGIAPYSLGNLVSDTGNRYLAGQNPLELFTRMGQGYKTLGGADPKLLREFELRGLPVSSWSGSILGDKEPIVSRLRDVADDVPVVGKIMGALGGVSEAWGKGNRWLLEQSNRYVEAPGRVGTALDYLAKEYPEFASMAPEAQALALDRAASFSKKAMVDYGGLSATQRELQKIAVPFAGWQFGMPALALEQATTHPERLSRVSRFLDTAFTPMSPEDKAVAEPYMQEGAPVTGVAGWQFPRDDQGNSQVMQLARFLPWGSLEGLTKRPANNVFSMINPFLKAPLESGLDLSVFQGGPIDKQATGFLENLYAPLAGRPYDVSNGMWFGQNIPRGWEYLMGQSPAGRNLRSMNDLARGLGAFEDPGKPVPTATMPEQIGSAATNFLTGTRFYGFDPDKQTRKRQREQDVQLRQAKSSLKWARLMGNDAVADHYQGIVDGIQERGKVGFTEGF